jgi:hypothetical protein
MPYFFDEEDESYWDDEYRKHIEADEAGELDDDGLGYEAPKSLFKYVDPWQANTALLSFPQTPGPKPLLASGPSGLKGLLARLFGWNAGPDMSHLSPKEMDEAIRAYELWGISTLAARCRDRGVKRVFGSYDGGSDESFTHFTGIQMRDSRVVPARELRWSLKRFDYNGLVDLAVGALMGSYGDGGFVLRGVVIIDVDACTITDEKNLDVVFGDKKPWEV